MRPHALRRSLTTIGLLIVSFVLLPLLPNAWSAVNLPYEDSFVDNDDNPATVDGWTEAETSIDDAITSEGTPRPGSPTAHHASLRKDASITQALNTAGFDNISLSYFWRGDAQAELNGSDRLRVLWRVNDPNNPAFSSSFTELTSYDLSLSTSTWSTLESHSLGGSAANTLIEIRFIGDTSALDETALIDDVSVTGTSFIPASVSVDKITNPAGNSQSFSFTLTGPVSIDTVNLADADSAAIVGSLLPGAYTLVETVPGGWDLTNISCDIATTPVAQGVAFTLAEDEHISCSFTNTKRASITVQKQILSPNGFDPADATLFTALLNGGSAQQFGEASSTVYANLLTGTYSISESSNSLYTFTSFSEDDNANPADGAQITLNPGEDAVLTITNTQKPGTINVAKNVFAPDSTTDIADTHPFTITLTGTQGHIATTTIAEGENAVFLVDPNIDYTVSEAPDNDYTILGCDVDHPACTGNVPSNSSTFITVGNAQKNGSITVQKDVLNPQGQPVDDSQSFTVDLDGQNPQTVSETSSHTYTDLAPGAYTINEINLPAGYTFDAFSIDEDEQATGAQITITSNQSRTLTISNRQQQGTITVQKNVVSFEDVDISDPALFTATVSGQPNQPFSENSPAIFIVNPGTYTVGELDPPNYDLVSILPATQVTITPGGSATTTITNRPSSATIRVHKVVQNPSSQVVPDDTPFMVTVTGQAPQTLIQSTSTVFTVGPGTYTIGEQDKPGYDLVSVSPSQVTLNSGSSVDVTITNRQRPIDIIISKDVLDPDSGPVNDPTSFPVHTNENESGIVTELLPLTLHGTPNAPITVFEGDVPGYDLDQPEIVQAGPGATTTMTFVNRQRKVQVTVTKDVKNPDGNLATDNHSFEVSVGNQTQPFSEDSPAVFMVNPGTLPIVETPDTDYTPDQNNQIEVTVGPGATTTVPLVNFQKRGRIEVIKDVLNPDLGPADDTTPFTVTVEGIGSQPLMEGATTTFDNLLPGDYTLSELTPSTHDLVDFSPNETVTVGSNKTVIVTIRNRQHPATIIVHKNIVGPDGETEVEDSHIFNVNINCNGGTQQVSEENPATFSVYPGTCAITELDDSNYILHSISPSSTVTILPDQTIEVTITNKPKLAMIKVNKFVLDVSDATTTDSHVFTVNANGNSLPLIAGTQTVFTLLPGFYTVSETPDPGYDTVSGSPTNVSVGPGQSTTMNIVNRQRPGKIVVHKNVISPDDEEVSDPTAFQIQFNGNPDQPIVEGATTTFDNLIPGTYTLTETQGIGYEPGVFSTTTPIVLDPGKTVEVTITNRQQPGSVSGMKWKDTNGDGVRDEEEPGIQNVTVALGRVSGPETPEGHIPIEIVALSLTGANGDFTIDNVVPGQYKLFEEQRDGWVPTVPWHVDSFFDITYRIDLLPQQVPLTPDSFFDVFVDPGQQVETGMPSGCQPIPLVGCALIPLEFGNFELGFISGMKWNDLNGDGVKDVGEPGLEGWTITLNPGNVSTTTDENGNYSFEGLTANTYTVSETLQDGWEQTFPQNPNTYTIPITSGTVVTGKNFGNRLRKGTITIQKITIGDDGTFNFTGLGGFSITTVSGVGSFSKDVEPGTYEVIESLPSLWDLTNIECSDDNSTIGPVGSGTATIQVEAGEPVTCTFTNTKRGKLIVQKTTYPSGDPTEFQIQILRVHPGENFLTDGRIGVITDSQDKEFEIIPGAIYFVNEEPLPEGWMIVSNNCDDIMANPGETITCEIVNKKVARITMRKTSVGDTGLFHFTATTNSTSTEFDIETTEPGVPVDSFFDIFVDISGEDVSVSEDVPEGWDVDQQTCLIEGVLPGDTHHGCVFTNTRLGRIIVEKVTIGGDDDFDFTTDYGPPFTLSNGESNDSELLAPDTYSVTESVPPGWDLTSPICDDGSDPLNIGLDPGETVTCTFTNTKRGMLTIVKEAYGGDDTFGFTHPTSTETFALETQNGRATTTFEFAAGTVYSVDEGQTPPGWDEVDNPSCQGTIQAGQNVECRFMNVKRGKIVVQKTTHPANDPQVFDITASGTGTITGGGAGTVTDALDKEYEVTPGTYSVAETLQAGWMMVSNGCENVVVPAGETKTCEIVNKKAARVNVEKTTVGGFGSFTFTRPTPTTTDETFELTTSEQNNPTRSSFFDVFVEIEGSDVKVAETVPLSWDADQTTCTLEGVKPGEEEKTCTFTNTKRGTLTIVKEAEGGDGLFTFTKPTTTADFFDLATENGRATTTFDLSAGTAYSVTEQTPPDGWQQVGDPQCQGEIQPGRDVECRFVNKKQATVKVEKETVGGFGTFHFEGLGQQGGFDLATDPEHNPVSSFFDVFVEIDGTTDLSLTEDVPSGWDADQARCELNDVQPGDETRTCKFKNTKRGEIHGLKFEDLNGNGQKDHDEPGIQDITVALGRVSGPETPEGHIPIEIVALSLTSVNGAFTIPDVAPGQYKLFEEQRDGWVPTVPWHVDSFFDITYRIDLLPQQKPLIPDSFFDVFVDPGQSVDTGIPSGCGQHPLAGGCEPVPLHFGNSRITRITGTKFNDVNGNGIQDEGEGGLAGWRIVAAKEVETLVVNSANSSPVSSSVLDNGVDYLVRVSGTYLAGDSITADAKYSTRPPNAVWTDLVQNYESFGTEILELQLNGASPNWGSYNSNHVYWHAVTGTGSSLNFLVNDIHYPSNSGNLTVTIYQVVAEATTGGEGSYTLEFIGQTGDIMVAEQTQTGWVQTHPSPDGFHTVPANTASVDKNFGNRPHGTLKVVKEAVNDDGGDAQIADFTLFIDGNQAPWGDEVQVADGVHNITEQGPSGYAPTYSVECPGGAAQVPAGQTVTCTVTNDDQPGKLIVQKTTHPAGDQTEFNISASGTGTVKNGENGTVNDAQDHEYIVTAGTYTVTETPPPGWMEVSNTCVDVPVGIGEEKTCEIVNKKAARITVRKTSVGDIGPFRFTAITNSTSTEFDIETIEPGVSVDSFFDIFVDIGDEEVTVVEQVPPGWDVNPQTCFLTGVMPGDTHHGCAFTNTKRGSITIIKDAIPDDPQDFEFTGDLGTFFLDDDTDLTLPNNTTTSDLAPGVYAINEQLPSSEWKLLSATCSDGSDPSAIDLQPGEEVTCTFTNLKRARIVTQKTSRGDTGTFHFTIDGDATSTAFDITTAQENVPVDSFFDVFVEVSTELSVRELVPPGWSADQESCTRTVGPGGEESCPFTNTRQGSIQGVKFGDLDGDSIKDGDETGLMGWIIELRDGQGTLLSSTTTDESGNYAFEGLAPGEYQVREQEQEGWLKTEPGGPYHPVTLSAGQTEVRHFGNFKLGEIRGMKFEDVDGDGALDSFDRPLEGWTIYLEGFDTILQQNVSLSTTTDENGEYRFTGLTLGDYTVTEELQPGWIATRSNPFPFTVNRSGDVIEDVDFGNFKLAEIHGFKYNDLNGNGTRDGGEPGLPGWAITITGPDSFASSTITDLNGAYWFMPLGPGNYTLSEELQAGWVQTEPAGNSWPISPASGQVVENLNFGNFEKPTLTVIKDITNDHGGAATSSDFLLHVKKDGADVAGSPAPGSATGTVYMLLPGDYAASEDPNENYTSEVSGDCDAQGNVSLAPGEHKTCTITNNDVPATITIEKTLPNDDGGTLTQNDFSYFIDGNPVTPGVPVPVSAGMHLVTESDASGYMRSFSNACSTVEGWDLSGLWSLDFILNSDGSHRFHAMNVTSFNSGTGAPEGTGSTTGTVPPPAPILFTWTMTGTETGNSFTMTIAYNEIPGYTVTLTGTLDGTGQMSGTWADNGSATGTFTGTGNPEPLAGKLTIGVGESATCTITNDDLPSILRVKKFLPNNDGGTAAPDQFSFSINGGDPVQFEPDGQNDIAVSAGEYDIIEINPLTGYIVSYQNCENVIIPNGGDATCTITNDDQPTTLTVEKIINNNNGGSATTSDFILRIDGSQVTHGVANTTAAGPHTVSEDAFAGYTGAIGGDCTPNGTVILNLGDQKTCTITNDDQATTITVIKQVINDNGGAKQVADFPLFIDGNPTTSSTTVDVLPGAHVVSETNQTGYTSTIGDGCDAGGNVTVALGEHKTCTIVNDDFQATLTMVKQVVNDDFGTAIPSQFSFLVGSTTVAHNQTVSLDAGTYAITESGPAGYALASYSADCAGGSITLALGDTKTCTVTNNDTEVFGSVAGFKWLDRDEDGVKDLTEPYLPGWIIALSPDGRATTTDANGAYYFDNITPGTHTVAETMQAGWRQTYPVSPGTHSVTITGAGEQFTNKNFGNVLPPSVAGVKFEDTNGNGAREQGEPLLPGWTIRLRNLSTNVTVTATTDANGAYRFANLTPGVSYRVSEVLKSGWVQTAPQPPGTYTVIQQNGDAAIDRDFGNFRLAEIRGLKYHDINGNGQKGSNEPGLSGWTIFLDTNNNGALNGGEPSTLTNASGTYSFSNLGPGTYRVREVIPSGWGQSQPGAANGFRHEVAPQSGEVIVSVNFGNYQFAEIHGRKYQDNNMNGARNAGEAFLSGWTIVLTHLNSGQIRSDVTDAQGRYDFAQLAPGNYQVREILKNGWVPINPRDTIHRITLVSGQNLTGLHFGNVTVAQLGGQQVASQSEGNPAPLTLEAEPQPQTVSSESAPPVSETVPAQSQSQPSPETTASTPPSSTPKLPDNAFFIDQGLLNTNLEDRFNTLRSRLGQ